MPDFFLEIGCEEIPARMIDAASQELRERIAKLLQRENLPAAGSAVSFDTPRRLAVLAPGIPDSQADISEQVLGPSSKIAFKDGQPTPAAHSFAKKVGLDLDKLQRVNTPKGEYLAANVVRKGRTASEILAEALPKEIAGIYWPKTMYWRKKDERFIRPVRWLIALLDGHVIPVEFGGVRAGAESYGHRTLGRPVRVSKPAAYNEALRSVSIVASREEREKNIRAALDSATRQIPGARWREDKELLDTVVNLTEWPSVILGNFEPEFLVLPEEVLVTVMRDHQKYFAIEDSRGTLLPNFLAVLNTDGDQSGIIRHGHERVLRARFNDARFFWDTDQKRPLRERVELLKHVTFQKDLGSYYEKTVRVQKLASWISELVKDAGIAIRPGIVHKAALLAKTDLTTELVKEFTELQGIVGGLYTRVQQIHRPTEPALPDEARNAVATAIYDHYKPESMDDAVPRTLEGAVLSLCDKADTVAGMFALGLVPSGSKDPFALRRQANAIIRIVAEHKLPLSLSTLFANAIEQYAGSAAQNAFKAPVDAGALLLLADLMNGRAAGGASAFAVSLAAFLRERLEFYLRDVFAIPYDVVNAVLASSSDDVNDAIARARAVSEVRGTDDFTSISAAFKRMKNILRQAAEKKIAIASGSAVPAGDDAESALAQWLAGIQPRFQSQRAARNYAAALREMATLRRPIDAFFDKVMVMVEDPAVRGRRLSLLQSIVNAFSSIADFSEIVTEAKDSPAK